jgi:hypothetical protein
MLPDDVLLAIFDFCGEDHYEYTKGEIEAWQSLVHVCRRWRTVVFGSRHRLNLRLFCTNETPVRDLDVWPPFPLVIMGYPSEGVGDIILEHRDRVDRIFLQQADSSAFEKVFAAMQEPFPELTDLRLSLYDKTVPVVPNSFLGGSAPRLRILSLDGIPFPGLPKLLLSTTHLVTLRLSDLPHSGYISPEAVVTALSTLTSLDAFSLRFESPRSHPDRASRRSPPLTRSILPVLTSFGFKGVYEYLDDFVARIDAPRLDNFSTTFFNDIVFDTPQFIQFVSRTPVLKSLERAHFIFGDLKARVSVSSWTSGILPPLEVIISCKESDWQVSSLGQVCTSCLPPLTTTKDLYIHEHPGFQPDWQDNVENRQWLELLRPFTTVKNLYLSKEFAPRIVPALQELVGDRTAEVLPALQNIFLEELRPSGPVQEAIGKFVASRRLSGHSITVRLWQSLRLMIDEVPSAF